MLAIANLKEAQKALGVGSRFSRQAIIPMTDSEAGDPHTLAKKWNGGSMWWWGWGDINSMQNKCSRIGPIIEGRHLYPLLE